MLQNKGIRHGMFLKNPKLVMEVVLTADILQRVSHNMELACYKHILERKRAAYVYDGVGVVSCPAMSVEKT